METRVAALEGKVASLKAMIQAMQLKAKENQETLMKMLSARFENVDVKTSTAKMTRKTEFSKPELSGIKNLHGESFDESRQSVKKVELPMCGVSKNEGTTTISEGRPMIRSLREEVQSRGVETRMSSSTATTLKGRVLRERNNGPPPPPPEPPDIGSLATTPVQPESPVVGSFATPNWSLLTTSPSALATEDPFLSKEEERGAVLIFGELGPVVDILGLAHTIWVMGKGGQQAKNGSPSEITKEPLQIEFPPPNLPKTSCVHKFEMYCKNLPLSKDLDPQESMHDEELLSLTGNILVQLLWRTKDVGYWVETTMILGFGLAIRRHVSQYKILLLHLYCHFGALSVAHEGYKSLDVKNMLMESLLHHILPQMLVSPLWTELNSLLKDYLKFMDNHFRESADLTCLAYCYRNYSKGILQSVRCGIHFRELSNRIASLTFSEDLQPRPWWTPTLENNYLLGPSEGIFYCPREILTKERETSLKRVRGAVLVVGRWGLVVDNLGLTQFDNTTWVQDKGGQHPRNGSPTDTKWVTKFSLTSKKDTRAEVKVQKMSQPFTQMSQAQIYFINWDHGIFDGQENGSLVSYMNSEVHGAVKEKREWLTRKAKVVLELLFVNKTSILHHCLLTASGIGEREALLRGINRAAMTLCFLAKNVTKNRAFDLRGNSSVIHIAWSLGFKLWDPGGSCFQLLQDPCSIRARQLLMQWKESMVEEAT